MTNVGTARLGPQNGWVGALEGCRKLRVRDYLGDFEGTVISREQETIFLAGSEILLC